MRRAAFWAVLGFDGPRRGRAGGIGGRAEAPDHCHTARLPPPRFRARPGPLLTRRRHPLHCRFPGFCRAAARAAAPLAAAPDDLQAAKNRIGRQRIVGASPKPRGPGAPPADGALSARQSRVFASARASSAGRKGAAGRLRFRARRQRACGPCARKPGVPGGPAKRHRTWRQEIMSSESANYFLSSGDASLARFRVWAQTRIASGARIGTRRHPIPLRKEEKCRTSTGAARSS